MHSSVVCCLSAISPLPSSLSSVTWNHVQFQDKRFASLHTSLLSTPSRITRCRAHATRSKPRRTIGCNASPRSIRASDYPSWDHRAATSSFFLRRDVDGQRRRDKRYRSLSVSKLALDILPFAGRRLLAYGPKGYRAPFFLTPPHSVRGRVPIPA